MKLLRDLFSKTFGIKKIEPINAPEHTPIKTVKRHRSTVKKNTTLPYVNRVTMKDAKDKKARRKANKISRKSRAINNHN